ncbi:MAG TPA: cytosine permease [Actinomycetota bacterium]|nr:cytosine permease [Actinomycetota bacterium]
MPAEGRTLSAFDVGVLWNDLSLGVLVLVTGGLLVPALGLPAALGAIVVGSVIGCIPLAAIARAGAREGLPGMVLFRPMLGRTGSYVPSLLNIAQLVGWTSVEFWAIGRLANALAIEVFGLDAFWLWLTLTAVGCTVLAIGGPVLVVKRFLERFGTWVVLASGVLLTVSLLLSGSIASAWSAAGRGGLPFWVAVDLVIVMPVSWLPLVADSTRFARSERGVFTATFVGYGLGNAWFYALGALLILNASAVPSAEGVGAAVLGFAAGVAELLILGLIVGELPNAFANIYSTTVSSLNVVPRASAASISVIVGLVAFLFALLFTVERYEVFLFLIGSVFVPLGAVFLALYFVRAGGRYGPDVVFGPASEGFHWSAVVPWAVGFVVYHWCVPTGPEGWVVAVEELFTSAGLPFPLLGARLGASLPSFAVAFLLSLVMLPRRRPQGG